MWSGRRKIPITQMGSICIMMLNLAGYLQPTMLIGKPKNNYEEIICR